MFDFLISGFVCIENVITGWAGVSGSPKNRVGQLIINEVKDARAKN